MFPTNTFIQLSLNLWYSRFAILLILVSACTTEPTQQPKPYITDLQTKNNTYTVQPGDTLYSIAKRYGKTVPELANWNKLQPPYTLQPGQLLLVQESSNTNKICPNCKQLSRGNRLLPVETTTPPKHCYPPVSWQWPTQPRGVTENISPTGQRGINISGQNGQPIYTGAAGTVTYSQSMKNGNYYLLIQHNQAFSSVYANLRNPQVTPGKRVAAEQLIATLGTDTLNRPELYFEIRCWGKTINPLDYLPKEWDFQAR